jgi:acyl-coenzyme A synthetase/AMP-(fatty) acid ligase
VSPLHEHVARWAVERAGHPAIIHEHGTLTYAELRRCVEGARRHFASYNCKPGQRVGLRVRNDPQSVVSLLALVAAGVEVLVHDARATDHEREQVGSLSTVDRWYDPVLLDGACDHSDSPLTPDGAAASFGLITSGTGGLPKVVRKDWQATIANSVAFAGQAMLHQGDRILCTTPLHHAFAFGVALVPALSVGASLVLAPHPPVPSVLATALTETGATVVQSVPFLYRALLALGRPVAAPSLRMCIAAGERLQAETADAWREVTGRPLRDQYGATELGQIAFADDTSAGPLRLVPGIRARLRDEHGQWCDEPGAEGELCFRQPGPGVRYWGLPELSRRVNADGWFRTGDIGRLPRGDTVVLIGRASRRITVAGRKVDPVEVEQAVGSVPGVLECVVSAPPEGTPGAGESFMAFVAARPGVTEIAIRRHLVELLSPYKIPTRFHLVETLPRTGSGKLHLARLWQEAELS